VMSHCESWCRRIRAPGGPRPWHHSLVRCFSYRVGGTAHLFRRCPPRHTVSAAGRELAPHPKRSKHVGFVANHRSASAIRHYNCQGSFPNPEGNAPGVHGS
jgi:hypothetical protein